MKGTGSTGEVHWKLVDLSIGEASGTVSYTHLDVYKRQALEQEIASLFNSHLEKLSTALGREKRDALEREILLKTVDMAWMDHIDNMDQLKQGIGLRSYGQNDPVKEYTKEGFAMFDEMVQEIQENTIRALLRCPADTVSADK